MKNKTKIRESNIELLRIFAMILIIIAHLTQHGIAEQITDKALYEPGMFFNNFTFYYRLIIIQFFRILGQIGNVIFILITGFFLASKKHIELSKSLTKLLSQILFATIILVLVSFIYYQFSDATFRGLDSFEIFYNEWWFVGYYIAVIIIGELFVNKFLSKLSKKEYTTFLLAMLAIICLKNPGDALSQISENIRTICTGVMIYSFGGYIKKFEPFKNIKSIIFILLIIITFIEIGISYYNYSISNMNLATYKGEIIYFQKFFVLDKYSIEAIVIGTSLFELFRRIKIKNRKSINLVAASTFMIYIIHETEFGWQLWQKTEWVKLYYYNMPKFFLYFFNWVIICFCSGLVAYFIYLAIVKFVHSKTFHKLIYKKGTI